MPLRSDPTARQLRLAVELRRLRAAAGLTARDAASLLGVTAPVISQIESGIAGVSEERLRRLVSHYACSDEEFINALIAMATDRTRGWWEEYRGLLPSPFLDLSELEHHARFQRNVAVLFTPGLLQTEDYARAVFSNRIPEVSAEEVELRVQHRMARRMIIEGAAPVQFEAVIHEAALRIRVSDRAASRAQLAHILELSAADHITVRVVPFDQERFSMGGSVMTYLGGSVAKLDTVLRDTPHGTGQVDSEAELAAYRARFNRVEAASLDPGQSRDFIHELAKEL